MDLESVTLNYVYENHRDLAEKSIAFTTSQKTFYGNNRQIVDTLFRGILAYSIVSFEILRGVRKINRLTRKPNNRITNIILLLIVFRLL